MVAGAVFLAVLGAAVWADAEGEPVDGFPVWSERLIHEWINRARCDPQYEMAQCGTACKESACYAPVAPLPATTELNRAARFHSDEMNHQSFFNHPSICTVVPNIDSIYPDSCDGSASCACVGGTTGCSPTFTSNSSRVRLFAPSYG